MKEHVFPKTERLKSSKLFREVILEGHSVFQHPLKLLFLLRPKPEQLSSLILTGFSISKRKHPKATTRNLLKRRMKEAYRKNKGPLYQWIQASEKYSLHVVIIYQVGEICNYHQVESAMVKSFQRLLQLLRLKNLETEL